MSMMYGDTLHIGPKKARWSAVADVKKLLTEMGCLIHAIEQHMSDENYMGLLDSMVRAKALHDKMRSHWPYIQEKPYA